MALNLNLDPEDPRYQKMLADMVRSGKIDPNTLGSQVARAANAPMSSGMMSGYVDEAQAEQKKKAFAERSADFSGQERKIKNQRDYADSLRGRAAPQGRTVGPLGVYYGPNWADSLAHAGGEMMGGYLSNKANKADEGLDKARTAQKAAEIAAAQADKDTAQDFENLKFEEVVRGNQVSEAGDAATLEQRATLAEDAAELKRRQGRLERQSRADIAAAGVAGQNARADEEMVYIGEDGKPDYSNTRWALPSPQGRMWGNGELVDPARWQGRNDPNLTAATSGESRGTAAQATAQYRANTFGDGLAGMKKRLAEGYDPGSPRALVDKYANKSDFLRGASTEAGQQYNSDANTVKEAALRTSTGAAAPNKENAEYMTTLIPGPWDTQGTQDFKMAKLETIHTRLLELAGLEGTTQADLDAESDVLIEDARREEGAIKAAATKQNGDTWEDETHRYRKMNGKLQSEKK